VSLAGFSFRNPPQYNKLAEPNERDAVYETEALSLAPPGPRRVPSPAPCARAFPPPPCP
jgi:hypothetical protein